MDGVAGNFWNSVAALLLVIIANLVPWLVGRVVSHRWSAPLDCGLVLRDGQRLLGSHKTWRGLLAGSLAAGLLAQLLGLGFTLGIGFGALSLLGDALSSSIKRRLRRSPGSDVPGLDQLPEALLPLLVFAPSLYLNWQSCLTVALIFMALGISLTQLRRSRSR
jgi:CDP-archaeol synthase